MTDKDREAFEAWWKTLHPWQRTENRDGAEMGWLGGISIKTYKNWLAAGLIARHPNGRGPMPHNTADEPPP